MSLMIKLDYGQYVLILSNELVQRMHEEDKCTTAINSLLSVLPSQCNIKNDKWMDQNWETSLGKLLVNYGYYDYKSNKFLTEFDPRILFFDKIHSDYKEFDTEIMDKKQLFTYTLNVECGHYQLHYQGLLWVIK